MVSLPPTSNQFSPYTTVSCTVVFLSSQLSLCLVTLPLNCLSYLALLSSHSQDHSLSFLCLIGSILIALPVNSKAPFLLGSDLVLAKVEEAGDVVSSSQQAEAFRVRLQEKHQKENLNDHVIRPFAVSPILYHLVVIAIPSYQ